MNSSSLSPSPSVGRVSSRPSQPHVCPTTRTSSLESWTLDERRPAPKSTARYDAAIVISAAELLNAPLVPVPFHVNASLTSVVKVEDGLCVLLRRACCCWRRTLWGPVVDRRRCRNRQTMGQRFAMTTETKRARNAVSNAPTGCVTVSVKLSSPLEPSPSAHRQRQVASKWSRVLPTVCIWPNARVDGQA